MQVKQDNYVWEHIDNQNHLYRIEGIETGENNHQKFTEYLCEFCWDEQMP